MTHRSLTTLAMSGLALLIAGSALAQSTGSGTGTPGATQPAPSQTQPSGKQPSMGTTPGKAPPASGKAQPGTAQPGMAQPGTGQTGSSTGQTGVGSGQTGSGAGATGAASNGQQDAQQVKHIQKALQEKGMDPGPIDGIMGPRTQTALRDFQKGQSLPTTGRLDSQTLEKLGVPAR